MINTKVKNSVMMKKTKKNDRRRRLCSMDSLPQDLVVEIATHLASTSPTPLIDMKNLRRTCKEFCMASRAKKVGRSMSVDKEWNKHWWDKEGYFAFLRHCANSNNPQACFVLGMEEIHNLGRHNSGLNHLQRAIAGGHRAAAYSLGMISFHDTATRSYGMELLNKVSSDSISSTDKPTECTKSGNMHVESCRREAAAVLRRISMKRWLLPPNIECGNQLCGRVVKGSNLWVGEEGLVRSFCSQVCRWKHECCLFYKAV